MNVDNLSRQRGPEGYVDIPDSFPNEFLEYKLPKMDLTTSELKAQVYHLEGEVRSEFQEVIDYLLIGEYLDRFTREKKVVFQF